jgi:hypothetical protein
MSRPPYSEVMNDEIVRRRLDELDDPGAAAVGLDPRAASVDATDSAACCTNTNSPPNPSISHRLAAQGASRMDRRPLECDREERFDLNHALDRHAIEHQGCHFRQPDHRVRARF